jgi:chemotaxis receptor (MCP) glutamine deamidase CheD
MLIDTPPTAAAERWIGADDYAVIESDTWLVASLQSSVAVCLYDAVHESGALIHLRMTPPSLAGRTDVSDATLSTNLELLERCVSQLRAASPRAQHWQAKIVAHFDEGAASVERGIQLQHFLAAFLRDAGVLLSGVATHHEPDVSLRFRPAMGQVIAVAQQRS